ncbi:MAG: hypothetical protein GOVbin2833_9 [Prokaryotic dsDNA virus sp.]|nr:MAG: hypothetical protein GOVbin2833_9 [Prokaryotic dsDNA virus sp.]|tara:strand:- start:18856 stop:19176 length:321 start_codon:yes stop_codon:yes gene_type:complete
MSKDANGRLEVGLFSSSSPDTSVEAAHRMRGLSSLRIRLFQWLDERGWEGATDEEMQEGTGIEPNTQRPRRKELQQEGKVFDSGERRKTRSGRNAIVWVVGGIVDA